MLAGCQYLVFPSPNDVLPDVPELLNPHRLYEEIDRAVRHAPQNNGRLAVGRHHCDRPRR